MSDKLDSVQIESASFCNAKCQFCPSGRKMLTRPMGTMDDALFRLIVDQAVAMGVRQIIPFGNGEPFAFKRIFDWLDYLQYKQVSTCIFTNGSLLSAEKAERLCQYKNIEFVMFSFHGGDKATYERVMGLDFDIALQNARFLIEKATFPVSMYMLDYQDTHASIPAFQGLWGQHTFISPAFYNWAGDIENPNKHLEQTQVPCGRVLNQLFVLWDGRVALCCMDGDGKHILGDLTHQTLQEVWHSNQAMRDRHRAHDFTDPLCAQCNLNRYR